MAYTLKEEDFFWIKLGKLKPAAGVLRYVPLTEEEQKETNSNVPENLSISSEELISSFVENTLIISETQQKVILPYKISEIKNKLELRDVNFAISLSFTFLKRAAPVVIVAEPPT